MLINLFFPIPKFHIIYYTIGTKILFFIIIFDFRYLNSRNIVNQEKIVPVGGDHNLLRVIDIHFQKVLRTLWPPGRLWLLLERLNM